MRLFRNLLTLTVIAFSPYLEGQEILTDRLAGFRMNGSGLAALPVVYPGGKPVAVEFESSDDHPTDFVLKVVHCDKDWNETQNAFINDPARMVSREQIPYALAPADIKGYRVAYSARIPGIAGIESLEHSGNYLVEVWRSGELVGRARMFVAEKTVSAGITIRNRNLPGFGYPENQVHHIAVSIAIRNNDSVGNARIYPSLLKSVDIYRNREIYRPWRIDADDRDPHTFIEGFGLDRQTFFVDNIPAGNAYRSLDLRDVDFYRSGRVNLNRNGADLPQSLHRGRQDAQGRSTITKGDRYAEIIDFRFELRWDDADVSPIYVVGDFNGWRCDDRWRLAYDSGSKRYGVTNRLRRGVYDYQYVNEALEARLLEGSDWRTTSVYSGAVYYHDPRLGGFDRLIGFVQSMSSGDPEAAAEH